MFRNVEALFRKNGDVLGAMKGGTVVAIEGLKEGSERVVFRFEDGSTATF